MGEDNDIALTPGFGADSQHEIGRFIPADILELYEVHSYKHAAAILHNSYPDELAEIIGALRQFRLTVNDILKPGGNESDIPKRISSLLRPLGWYETRIKGDLLITMEIHQEHETRSGKNKTVLQHPIKRDNYLDGHKVDYVKKSVAFDLEWNSKDQTFDRDLYAFRAFSDCGLIGAGILLTRSAALNPVFSKLGVKAKYGASTTWMGKLLYRMNAGRHGGCPVLIFGITPNIITDLSASAAPQ
ncbi:MAG: BglII/BstYI family type II restriction endonuclease [Methylovulum sp.]|nr:BglII/BstYI family type II restriction endonuclease [Methylovulum sp.]